MKIAVAIITFNTVRFLQLQLMKLKSLMVEEADFYVCDNSTDPVQKGYIKKVAKTQGSEYIDFENKGDLNTSKSHGQACGKAFDGLKEKNDIVMLLDHDIFPVKAFSIEDLLRQETEEKLIAGRHQQKGGVDYIWPGFVAIRTSEKFTHRLTFMPVPFGSHEKIKVNLDTGGETWEFVQRYPEMVNLIPDQPEGRYQGIEFDYIWGQNFVHCVNGSNWRGDDMKLHRYRVAKFLKMVNSLDFQEKRKKNITSFSSTFSEMFSDDKEREKLVKLLNDKGFMGSDVTDILSAISSFLSVKKVL